MTEGTKKEYSEVLHFYVEEKSALTKNVLGGIQCRNIMQYTRKSMFCYLGKVVLKTAISLVSI